MINVFCSKCGVTHTTYDPYLRAHVDEDLRPFSQEDEPIEIHATAGGACSSVWAG